MRKDLLPLFLFLASFLPLPSSWGEAKKTPQSHLREEKKIGQLKKLSYKMKLLLEKGRSCSLQEEGGAVFFCTGLILFPKDISFLKGLNKASCIRFLEQLGFSLALRAKNRGGQNSEGSFMDYKKRTFFLPKEAKRRDCLYEVLRYYQLHRERDNPLSPRKRNVMGTLLQDYIEEEVSFLFREVEQGKMRKKFKGNSKGKLKEKFKEKFKERLQLLRELLSLQKKWIQRGDELDRREIHQFMSQYGLEVVEKNTKAHPLFKGEFF